MTSFEKHRKYYQGLIQDRDGTGENHQDKVTGIEIFSSHLSKLLHDNI